MRLTGSLGLIRRYLENQTAHYVSRTVMVNDNNVEAAMKVLNGIMSSEGMMKRWKVTRRYEKPTVYRNRLHWEKSKAIYDEEMQNKLNLIMKKNRKDPYPGCH